MAATFVVETGTGSSTANAYVSVATADQYHENYGDPAAWSGATTAVKENAIREATRYMDGKYVQRWRGYRATKAQRLDWPRRGVSDVSGWERDSDSVPVEVQESCAALALEVVNGDTLHANVDAADRGITEETVQVGPIREGKKYSSTKPNFKSYSRVDAILRPLLEQGKSRVRG